MKVLLLLFASLVSQVAARHPEQSDLVFCGGFAGLQCSDQNQCYDSPFDHCNANCGGADCGGFCGKPTDQQCGGIQGLTCSNDSDICVYDDGACTPECGGADCMGKCVAPAVKLNTCTGGKVWNPCGSSCPLICGQEKPEFCLTVCVEGCFCPAGTIDNGKGECVEKCTVIAPVCRGDKVFSECGSACPVKCNDETDPFCTLQCVKGCFCPAGTIDNGNDECVKECPPAPKECPITGQVFKQCGSACPPTCGEDSDRPCTEQCVSGCFCDDGLFLDQDAAGNVKCVRKCKPVSIVVYVGAGGGFFIIIVGLGTATLFYKRYQKSAFEGHEGEKLPVAETVASGDVMEAAPMATAVSIKIDSVRDDLEL